eukprot:jgi/Psemu1/326310/estExt_fgenesh1_pg.C_3620005
MTVMRPYQFCSKQECSERQDLRQVSELEATVETCLLPQSKRILDPRYAVTKYRRSAAGSNDDRPVRGRKELVATLAHLTQICATFRATPNHPRVENLDAVAGFVMDRLRACQSDATRLMSGNDNKNCVLASWHACVIRILIWLQYNCCGYSTASRSSGMGATATDTARAIHHMRSTAYDAYWNSSTDRYRNTTTMSTANIVASLETSWNGMLLEFAKRRREGMTYPLWNIALEIASHARREEYYVLWKENNPLSEKIPILARSILSGEILLPWRYRTVQHYNLSFAKGEMVADMNLLLGIGNFSRQTQDEVQATPTPDTVDSCWSVGYAKVFGLPVEEEYNNENDPRNTGANETIICPRPTIRMKLKHVAMPEFDYGKVNGKLSQTIRDADRRWIFGKYYDGTDVGSLGLSSDSIRQLLEFGSLSSRSNGLVNSCFHVSCALSSTSDDCDEPLNDIIGPSTSLSRVLRFSGVGNSDGNHVSASFADSEPRNRTSPLKIALDRIKMEEKKKRKICRFFRTSKGCRFGDKCRFDHE